MPAKPKSKTPRTQRAQGNGAPSHVPFVDPLRSSNGSASIPDAPISIAALDSIASAPSRSKRDRSEIAHSLNRWFETHVSERGFLRDRPASTAEAITILSKIRGSRKPWWSGDLEERYLLVVTAACHLARKGGWLLHQEAISSEEENALQRWARIKEAAPQMKLLLDVLRAKKSAKANRMSSSISCETAKIACVRSSWSRKSAKIAVDYSSRDCRLDLAVGDEQALYGEWNARILVDDMEIEPPRAWQLICHNADEDGHYLEIMRPFEDGVVHERQIYLARQPRVCLFADTVKAPNASRVRLETKLPVSRHVSISKVVGKPALSFEGRTLHARFLPLALPTAKSEAAGSIAFRDSVLMHSLEQAGQAIVAPLALVWDFQPLEDPRPWRHLTVTNDGRRVSNDEAVAFRFVHQGKHIVLLRSLTDSLRCAFMGHQTFHETVIGRISAKGTFKEWIGIEREEGDPSEVTAHHIEAT